MPGWASALLGAAVGGAAALTATWLELKHLRREREDARREQAAALVGRVLSLLRESKPAPGGTLKAALSDLEWRWGELRLSLDVLGAGHPSAKVGELKDQLVPTVDKTLETLKGLPASSDQARANHTQAEEKARALLAEVRRSRSRR